jgi:carboxypeptidase Taq
VNDVPAAWNDDFRELFGFTPKNDREGCLQDIHWSMGGLGYFPTYTLGNIHSASLFACAKSDANIASAITLGDYAPLLAWLRQNIHAHGSTLDPSDLIQQATGKKPSSEDYIKHLTQRYL